MIENCHYTLFVTNSDNDIVIFDLIEGHECKVRQAQQNYQNRYYNVKVATIQYLDFNDGYHVI